MDEYYEIEFMDSANSNYRKSAYIALTLPAAKAVCREIFKDEQCQIVFVRVTTTETREVVK